MLLVQEFVLRRVVEGGGRQGGRAAGGGVRGRELEVSMFFIVSFIFLKYEAKVYDIFLA